MEPDAGAAVVEEEAIPAPHIEPYYENASLVNLLPVPYPHPGAHLWAGRCHGCESLVKSPCPPAWASIDALWLQRDGVDGEALAIDQAAQVVLRADEFDFNYEMGVRLIYGEVINCIPLEVTYLGMHDWNSSISFDGVDLEVPFGPNNGGAFQDADTVDANYASELQSIELNVLKLQGCNMTWMTGIRYIDAEEDFLAASPQQQPGESRRRTGDQH